MKLSEFRKNFPLNPNPSADPAAFSPIYDPKAIATARKVNVLIGWLVALGLVIFGGLLIVFVATSLGRSDSEIVAAFGTTLVPVCMLFGLAPIGLIISQKFGARIDKLHEHTKVELRLWLQRQTGEPFPSFRASLKAEIAGNAIGIAILGPVLGMGEITDSSSSDSTRNAAALIADGNGAEGRTIEVLSKALNRYELIEDREGNYRIKS